MGLSQSIAKILRLMIAVAIGSAILYSAYKFSDQINDMWSQWFANRKIRM